MWRLLVSNHLSVRVPGDVLTGMTLSEVLTAHELLDIIEEAEHKAATAK